MERVNKSMRNWLLIVCLACSVGAAGQSSSAPSSASSSSGSAAAAPDASVSDTSSAGRQTASQTSSTQPGSKQPSSNQAPPRSDRVNAGDLDRGEGQSSSKENPVDLSPPPGDDKAHPQSADTLMDAEAGAGSGDVSEVHPWNPHKAAKDIEVGDFYFKRKNYRAAEDRYREALLYKDNDALATFRLAVCLEKMGKPGDARKEYEAYLKILPHGPLAQDAEKAVQKLKSDSKPIDQ